MTWPRRTFIAVLALLAAALLTFIGAKAGTAAEPTGRHAACPGQSRGSAPVAAQERTMFCLVNNARRARGLEPLAAIGSLTRAADRKSADILRCDEFSHEACGREFTYWMTHFGYQGCTEGENIAWGAAASAPLTRSSGPGCTPRATGRTSSAPTRTSASACGPGSSKATAAPTS